MVMVNTSDLERKKRLDLEIPLENKIYHGTSTDCKDGIEKE